MDGILRETGMGPIILFAGIFILLYVFMASGLQGLAKRRLLTGLGWLGWIPIANIYLFGRIVDDIYYCNGYQKHYRFWLLITFFANIPAGWLANSAGDIRLLGLILLLVIAVVDLVLYLIGLYAIYSDYAQEYRVVFLVLSIFVPGAFAFLLFFIRKREGESVQSPPGYWENGVYYLKGANPPRE